MPFTFAHPAAVLPFVKKHSKHISVTALILGSMAPDFEYFLHFRPYGVIGHTWLGFLYLNLPLVFLLAYIYHYILKKSFITHLPKPFAGYYTYILDKRWGRRYREGILCILFFSIIRYVNACYLGCIHS